MSGLIVVFGGTGFIGGALVERLRSEGREVVVASRRPEVATSPGHRFADLLRPETLVGAVRDAEVVVQSTCFRGYPFEKPRRRVTFERYDAEGSERLVEAARCAGVRRYLYVSGVGAETPDDKPYFAAIRRAERAVERSGMEWACLRPTFVFGPNDNGLNRVLRAASRTHVLPVIGLDAMHQPVFIDDVTRALARLSELGAPTGTFEIGGPERMLMRSLLDRTFDSAGIRCGLVPVPPPLAHLGAKVLARMPGELLSTDGIRFVCEDFVAEPNRSPPFDIDPTPLEIGLRTYLNAR